MSRLNMLPSFLLTLSFKIRLGLAVVSTLIFLLLSVSTCNPAVLCIPLALSAWLFRKRGLLLCVVGMLIVQWAVDSFKTGSVFLALPTIFSLFIEALAFVLVGLLICSQRVAVERIDMDRQQVVAAYEKLQETQQAKDQLVANVTHELRTSLTSVSGYLDLLEEHNEFLDDDTRALFLRYAREGSNELVLSVNAILETMRSNAETRSVQLEPVLVAQVVREAMDHLAPQLVRDHPTRIEIDERVKVHADRQYLRQVIRNLLSNAFKYSPTGSPVIVRAQEAAVEDTTSGQICISIQDRGPGIPPSEQTHIFQQFVRLERDLSGSVCGSGIGLYTSKQLIEKMGGKIWVESAGKPGEGCCFCFLLPYVVQSKFEKSEAMPALPSSYQHISI